MIYSTFFFFSSRRRHTRLQGDWSSDVCSSDLAHQLLNVLRGCGDDGQPDRERVAREDRRERLADDCADAPAIERLRRMLARRATTEVRVGQQNRGFTVLRLIERMGPRFPLRIEPLVDEGVLA